MDMTLNSTSLDTICAALAYAMGADAPIGAANANNALTAYLDRSLQGSKCDRLFLYNPDAVAQWIAEKYAALLKEVTEVTDLALPLCSVMPSVTPVCFATMYTGLQPEKHGIRAYKKPVLTVQTLFDTLIAAGKKIAIVATTNCSIAKIFLERQMDYFIYEDLAAVNAKAAQLILEDRHDVIVVYNGNYDEVMHKTGPEGIDALSELRINTHCYRIFDSLIAEHWKQHRTLLGFATDHGCHEIDGSSGSHGLDMPEDLNILHYYRVR